MKRVSSATFYWPARVGVALFLVLAAIGAAAAWFVPPLASLPQPLWETVCRGPASAFAHVFDPLGLLGDVADVDRWLAGFEERTTHAIVFAALPSAPADVPDFTMRVAELWRPGARGANNGLIVFIFPDDRRVRVEVGYDLEPVLADIEVLHLVERHLVPALRAGQPAAGVRALAEALVVALEDVPPGPRLAPSRLQPIRAACRSLPRQVHFLWRVWLGATVEGRLLVATLAAAFIGFMAVPAVRLAHAAILIGRWRFGKRKQLAPLTRYHLSTARDEALEALKLLLIAVAMITGIVVFAPGGGAYGGGGVDVLFEG